MRGKLFLSVFARDKMPARNGQAHSLQERLASLFVK